MADCKQLSSLYSKIINKKYRQFDPALSELSAAKFVREVASKPTKVASHRFYPFIMYSQKQARYHRSRGHLRAHLKNKVRPIALVAHRDALIYATYSSKLEQPYEEYLSKHNLERVPTAYRKKLKHSNINAAKEVFDFIVDTEKCWIIKGDFQGFFDNLRHKILKKNLCNVLQVSELSKDWQAVFNSLTRYRSVNSRELELATKNVGFSGDTSLPYVHNRQDIEKLHKIAGLRFYGPNQVGIPQGTSLSAILANVYMTEFDEKITNLTTNFGGMYRRYSDDFIIVVPQNRMSTVNPTPFIDDVRKLSDNLTKLTISKEKTKVFSYDKSAISSKITLFKESQDSTQSSEAWLDYLGFVFNGDIVRMRDKGVYKFHYKSKRAIDRFLRIENDRSQIQNNKIIPAERKQRKVWVGNKQILARISAEPKRDLYKQRIAWSRKNMDKNLTEAKLSTRMYLSGRRYGEHFSMVGYAKRAQSILENNKGRYKVQVLSQITRQLHVNQVRVHKTREEHE
ncbi:reverse transcriptase/maturase family protein [Lacticaseibacillus suibinensis]|uniref:reverse transcriptase/maturase family protein n=1 Tax=Lacticaseibacillus suibinensis TaxID=2486011 RepID=UPI0019408DA0|nr:reverse transcriptase/maturase family protein [Lacticaseibacillus suibinensis]